MGVMSCSRRGCPNIMCDTHVDNIGYVCFDCQQEFQLFLQERNENPKNENEIRDSLESFMETNPRKKYGEDELSVDEFFRKYSR